VDLAALILVEPLNLRPGLRHYTVVPPINLAAEPGWPGRPLCHSASSFVSGTESALAIRAKQARVALAPFNAADVGQVDFGFKGELFLRQLPLVTKATYILAQDANPALQDGAPSYALLIRAVAALERNTPEARQELYDRARKALADQLRARGAAEPEIMSEQQVLTAAIHRVEGTTPQPPPPPAARKPHWKFLRGLFRTSASERETYEMLPSSKRRHRIGVVSGSIP
jgi:hypothetical protein